MADDRPPYACHHCGARAAYQHDTNPAGDRPERVRFRCRSCKKSWSSHAGEVWFGLRTGGRHDDRLSAYERFFQTVAAKFLRAGLPDAIRNAREVAGISAPTASRWIGGLTGGRYAALRAVTGPHHKLLGECLGVYRGRFPPPRRILPTPILPHAGGSPVRAAQSILAAKSERLWECLVRARTMAALVTGTRSAEILVDAAITLEHDRPVRNAWRRDMRVGGALFLPSWLDAQVPGRNFSESSWPRSAYRIGLDSLSDFGSIIRHRTPAAWWESEAAQQWLRELNRQAWWESETAQQWLRALDQREWPEDSGSFVGSESDPGVIDWLERHPPPPPIELDTLTTVVRAELSALASWIAATNREPDFDARHGWSYWMIAKHRVVRIVVATPRRVIGFASTSLGSNPLPVRFALEFLPKRRVQGDPIGNEDKTVLIPFEGYAGPWLWLLFPTWTQRIRAGRRPALRGG